jgi:GT2 family glycosyltransferase
MFLNNLTAVIVTYKSSNILIRLVKLLQNICKIIIVENSNNIFFKHYLERNFINTKCILTKKNLGYGAAANIGVINSKTSILLLINPDALIKFFSIKNLYKYILANNSCAMVAPMNFTKNNKSWTRYGFYKNKAISSSKNYIDVDYVSGHLVLVKKKIVQDVGMFDKKIFLNFEDRDLCFRLKKKNYRITVLKNSKVMHLEGKSSFDKLKSLKLLKWHFGWSIYYFYKKNFGVLHALKFTIPFLFNILLRFFFAVLLLKKNSQIAYLAQIRGLVCSFLGFRSFYR